MKVWTYDPHGGGHKVPLGVQTSTIERAAAYAKQQSWNPRFELKLQFRGQFCYLSAREKDKEPDFMPIGRLRYFREDKWSLAFYTYSNEKYTPCHIGDGEHGTIEQGIAICSTYLI